MSRVILPLLVALLLTPVHAGVIKGRVEARPPEGVADSGGGGGGYGSRKFKFLERINYDELRDFVVYIDRVSQPAEKGSSARAEVLQKDGEFSPHILPIVQGSEVEFVNFDEIYHNVFSMSEACEFDLGLYKKGDGRKVVEFALPGRVDVFCSIHAKMSSIVLVLPNPWFARTDERGQFQIKDVPPGHYRLKAWHERVPAQIKEIDVPESGEVDVAFVLGLGRQ